MKLSELASLTGATIDGGVNDIEITGGIAAFVPALLVWTMLVRLTLVFWRTLVTRQK